MRPNITTLITTLAILALTFVVGCNSAPSTDVWTAATEGDIAAMKQHIAAGTDINQPLARPGDPGDGASPLHLAAISNQLEMLDLLITNGATVDLRASNETGASPLMWAAAAGQLESATRLIAAGADVNYVDNNGATAIDATLMFEPQKNRESKTAIAELLRSKGGQSSLAPKTIDDIWTASASGNTEAVIKHLKGGVDVNGLDPTSGSTPLIFAALFGQTEAARLLLERKADLTLTSPDGNSPLHVAALFAHPETVRMLLEQGANAAARNQRGETPLDTVAAPWSPLVKGVYDLLAATLRIPLDVNRIKTARPQVATILRDHSGTASDPNPQGEETANIVLAVTKGYLPTVNEYLADGGDPNRLEPLGKSPLLLVACLHGHADVVAALLTAGADVNLSNPEGDTPLHIGILVAYPEVVKLLLAHGADTDRKNKKGDLPTASVEAPWQAIKPIYGFLGSILQMQFDTTRIEKERVVVAELLKNHAANKESGQAPQPATKAP
ncbi:MAG: ankyrin repeat domain-containing protein [Planctomycetota bacterium]|nr:ankyrin repeat domain-containing protein [Planctomycetota bacterium]